MDLFRINFLVKGLISFFFWLYSPRIIDLSLVFPFSIRTKQGKVWHPRFKKIDNAYWTLWKRRHHLRSHSLSQRIKLFRFSKLDYPSSENWPMLCLSQEHPTGGRCSKDCHSKYQVLLTTSLIVHEPLASKLVNRHCFSQTNNATQTWYDKQKTQLAGSRPVTCSFKFIRKQI